MEITYPFGFPKEKAKTIKIVLSRILNDKIFGIK
jgi:hypothetical protein